MVIFSVTGVSTQPGGFYATEYPTRWVLCDRLANPVGFMRPISQPGENLNRISQPGENVDRITQPGENVGGHRVTETGV